MTRKLLIWALVISGIFVYAVPKEADSFYTSQFAVFVGMAGLFLSSLIYKKNKYVSMLCVLSSFGIVKTLLFQEAPKVFLFEYSLISFAIFTIYYFIREENIKEDLLKWVMIPAVINCLMIIVQKFDGTALPFFPATEITGFIGNKSTSAGYLALSLPIFLKYNRWLVPAILFSIVLCNSFFAFMSAISVLLIYLFFVNKKVFLVSYLVILISICGFLKIKGIDGYKEEARLRTSIYLGVLDGIKENPILGWGIGSFLPVVSKIPPEESVYFGRAFNTSNYILNNTHNEILSGWWKLGIGFPILIGFLVINLIRKFEEYKITPFLMIVSGCIFSMGWVLNLPILALLILGVGVYENEGELWK